MSRPLTNSTFLSPVVTSQSSFYLTYQQHLTVDHPTLLEAPSSFGFYENTLATYLPHWLHLQCLSLVFHPLKNAMSQGSGFGPLLYSQLLVISPNLLDLYTIYTLKNVKYLSQNHSHSPKNSAPELFLQILLFLWSPPFMK